MKGQDEQDAGYEAWKAWDAAEWAAGRCSDSGLTRHACHTGPCDCFDPATCAFCLIAQART